VANTIDNPVFWRFESAAVNGSPVNADFVIVQTADDGEVTRVTVSALAETLAVTIGGSTNYLAAVAALSLLNGA
jgi:hypothetical protein